MEEPLTLIFNEIDEMLDKMDKKYNCHSSPQDAHLVQLLKEFDSLGITGSEKDIIPHTLKLIHMYRKLLGQVKKTNINMTKVRTENLELQRKIDTLEKKLTDKNCTIDNFKKKSVLTTVDQEQLKSDKEKLHRDLKSLRRIFENKENVWKTQLRQLTIENATLRDQLSGKIGQYRSQDDIFVSTIARYKQNEEIYKDTIVKLQDNNRGLLDEILNLKEEVVSCLIKKYDI